MKKLLLSLTLALLIGVGTSNAQDNVVINGNFTNGSASWTIWHAAWEPWLTYNFNVVDNWAVFSNMNVGTVQHWYLQMNQVLTPTQIASLAVGHNYTLRFNARAEGQRQIKVFFGEDGGGFTDFLPANTAGVGHLVNLTIDIQEFAIEFPMSRTFTNMKLGFEGGMGNIGFSITNVSLTRNIPSSAPQNTKREFMAYTLPSMDVMLVNLTPGTPVQVFSITGSLIETTIPGTTSIKLSLAGHGKGIYLVKHDGQTERILVK